MTIKYYVRSSSLLTYAIFPAIISLETVTFGIKRTGAAKTAVLRALEPLTALFYQRKNYLIVTINYKIL